MRRLLNNALFVCCTILLSAPAALQAQEQEPVEADISFPDQGDEFELASAPRFSAAGDRVSGSRTVELSRIDDLDISLAVDPNELAAEAGCVLTLDVTINDVPCGSLQVAAGDELVQAFLTPAEDVVAVDGAFSFALEVAESLPQECGSITLPLRRSTWHLERQEVPGNARPRGSIGGPYEVEEGGVVQLFAEGSDPEGGELAFAWDFDGDGQFDDAEGPSPLFEALGLDGPLEHVIGLRLSDPDGAVRELSGTVAILNVGPRFDRSAHPATIGAAGVLYDFLPTVLDPCPLDTLTFSLLRKPTGMAIDGEGHLQWTPAEGDVGESFEIKLKVEDDDGDADILEWDVRVVDDINTPSVNAGEDTAVDPGCVQLRCEGSSPRGLPLRYQWQLERGPADVVFDDPEQAEPSAVVTTAGTYIFSCVATEDAAEEEQPLTSPPDEVVLTVNNLPPIADPGFTTFAKVGQRVTLDGRRSIDPNGDGLRYRWEQTSGETVRIAGFTNHITSFLPESVDTYCFTLTVQDAEGLAGEPAEICVVVNEPGDPPSCADDTDCRARQLGLVGGEGSCKIEEGELRGTCQPAVAPDSNPVAWAGEDQRVEIGQEVRLRGNRSHDPDSEQPFLEEYMWTPCSSLAEQVALSGQGTMMPSFVPQTPGRYCFSLVVLDQDGHHSLSDEVWVLAELADNRAPRAIAGAGMSVQMGEEVVLDASKSRDPEGEELTYRWEQLRGPGVELDYPEGPVARFCAAIPGIYQFRLVVSDGTTEGLSDEVWVTVSSSCNEAPTAKAGVDFSVQSDDGDPDTLEDWAVLDGRQTFDPDPAPQLEQRLDGLRFQWVQVGGMPVDLQLPFTQRPWFRTSKWGIYTFRLFVLDHWPEGDPEQGDATEPPPDCWQEAWSLPDDVVVTVNDPPGAGGNAVPVADAGLDWDCLLGERCELDGSGSEDADQDALSFMWEQIDGPPLDLRDTATDKPWFEATELGEWSFRLVVSDGYIQSLPDVVRIRVRTNDNSPPLCRAGWDAQVEEGSEVTLNGCGTLDQNGDSLSYTWNQVQGPSVELEPGTFDDECRASFIAPDVSEDSELVFELVANDGRTDCDPDQVVITVLARRVCEPGREMSCNCESDGDTPLFGTRRCLADGSGWTECEDCRAPRVCPPGEAKLCYCDDGSRGTQTCAGDGMSWGECTNCEGIEPPAETDDESSEDDGCSVAGGKGASLPSGGGACALLVGLLLTALRRRRAR